MRLIYVSLATLLMLNFAFATETFARDDAKEIVIDNENGLVWQDNLDSKKLRKNFDSAVKYCDQLQHAGYTDWRLPTMDDYDLIIEAGKRNPVIPEQFKFYQSNYYWTADEGSMEIFAHRINLFNGNDNDYSKSYRTFVRCVRGGEDEN